MRRTALLLLFVLIMLYTHNFVLAPQVTATVEAREAQFYYIHRL